MFDEFLRPFRLLGQLLSKSGKGGIVHLVVGLGAFWTLRYDVPAWAVIIVTIVILGSWHWHEHCERWARREQEETRLEKRRRQTAERARRAAPEREADLFQSGQEDQNSKQGTVGKRTP